MNENPLSHILEYNLDLGKTKPDTVHRDEKYCPFCDVAHLKNVMEKRGPMIWLENAYPVLKDSWQTLIIESDDCDGEFSSYTPEYALKLIQFGLEKWQQVNSQIVGFKDYDYHQDIKPFHFVGPAIVEEDGLTVNLSQRPIIGFYEVNLILKDREKLGKFVRYMQRTADYFMHSFVSFNDSYNIFFYDFPADDALYVKIIPRFLTNPLYVGYMIPQIANGGHSARFIHALQQRLHEL